MGRRSRVVRASSHHVTEQPLTLQRGAPYLAYVSPFSRLGGRWEAHTRAGIKRVWLDTGRVNYGMWCVDQGALITLGVSRVIVFLTGRAAGGGWK